MTRRIEPFAMVFRGRVRNAGAKGRAAVRLVRDVLHLPVICIQDEEEQDPESIRREPIISVNGRDIRPDTPDQLHQRKTA